MSNNNAYRRVRNQNQQESQAPKNEIRITGQGRSRNIITYAVALLDPTLLPKDEKVVENTTNQSSSQQQQYDAVVLKAMGKAIQKAVTIAEVLKRRVPNLHQITSIESQTIEDQYAPQEEGLDTKTQTRIKSSITITLSKKPIDKSHVGYQEPIPLDQVVAQQQLPTAVGTRRRSFRGRDRGQSQQQQQGRGTRGGRGGFRGGRGQRRGGFRGGNRGGGLSNRGGQRRFRGGNRGGGNRGPQQERGQSQQQQQ
ncbi:hypothetical protein ABK040_008516 [Willaertia magna]